VSDILIIKAKYLESKKLGYLEDVPRYR